VTAMGTVRSVRSMRLARRALDGLLVALVAAILVALVLGRLVPFFGGTTLVVSGPSMGEAVPIGAAAVATPVDPRDLAVGDIVSMKVGARQAIFTHRVIRIVDRDGEVWLETKGDANPDPDPAIVPASAVIGRVSLVVPDAGYLLALLSTVFGLAFIVGLAAFLITGAWLLESAEVEPDLRAATESGHASLPSAAGLAAESPLPAP
jgi:signal peptidase I